MTFNFVCIKITIEVYIMLTEFLNSKIHRAAVTDANLNYSGSITIDAELLAAANMKEWQKAEILDVNNGERFQTYIIKGKAGSGEICLNGAAARKVQTGDKVIIVTYISLTPEEALSHKPTIVMVDDENKITNINR